MRTLIQINETFIDKNIHLQYTPLFMGLNPDDKVQLAYKTNTTLLQLGLY